MVDNLEQQGVDLYEKTLQSQEFETEEKFTLTAQERQSALWKKLDIYFAENINELRKTNDGPYDEVKTARIRGKIQQLKEIRSLGKEPEALEEPDSPDANY